MGVMGTTRGPTDPLVIQALCRMTLAMSAGPTALNVLVQNASLAGGVAIGSAANLNMTPAGLLASPVLTCIITAFMWHNELMCCSARDRTCLLCSCAAVIMPQQIT